MAMLNNQRVTTMTCWDKELGNWSEHGCQYDDIGVPRPLSSRSGRSLFYPEGADRKLEENKILKSLVVASFLFLPLLLKLIQVVAPGWNHRANKPTQWIICQCFCILTHIDLLMTFDHILCMCACTFVLIMCMCLWFKMFKGISMAWYGYTSHNIPIVSW